MRHSKHPLLSFEQLAPDWLGLRMLALGNEADDQMARSCQRVRMLRSKDPTLDATQLLLHLLGLGKPALTIQ